MTVAAWLVVSGLSVPAWAQELRCEVCGKRIEERYVRQGDRVFCSKRCYESTLPVCAACGRRITGTYLTHDGRTYCSDRCFERTLPTCEICGRRLREVYTLAGHTYCRQHAESPRCFHCGLPFGRGKRLQDGRHICERCDHGLIYRHAAGERLFRQAIRDVQMITGLKSPTPPPFDLVGLGDMDLERWQSHVGTVVERGRYRRLTNTTEARNVFGRVMRRDVKVAERIRILYGLRADQFRSTAVHELMHDIIAEYFPEVSADSPMWVEEGVCQYVSAIMCRRHGFEKELRDIESSPHPVYGSGYRFFRHHFGATNWGAVAGWLREVDLSELPDACPVR